MGLVSTARSTRKKTLWEEGCFRGPLVRTVVVLALLLAATLDVLAFDRLTWVFDVVFVLVSLAASLAVRPRDFFVVGVLPPLTMLGVIVLLAAVSPPMVAEPGDGLGQAIVSGLAHHAGTLVTGYALALVVLALRQVALRNAGRLRPERASSEEPTADIDSGQTPAAPTAPASTPGPVLADSTWDVPDTVAADPGAGAASRR